jgi:hypothetical protein
MTANIVFSSVFVSSLGLFRAGFFQSGFACVLKGLKALKKACGPEGPQWQGYGGEMTEMSRNPVFLVDRQA